LPHTSHGPFTCRTSASRPGLRGLVSVVGGLARALSRAPARDRLATGISRSSAPRTQQIPCQEIIAAIDPYAMRVGAELHSARYNLLAGRVGYWTRVSHGGIDSLG